MRVALVNPPWRFEHSIYFGCREPHLPVEFGYARTLLEQAGHEVLITDGHLMQQDTATVVQTVRSFRPDMTVVCTAPSYLFWRCAPPELRMPREMLLALGDECGMTVVVGPHGSVTPGAALRKLGVDVVVRGECEEAIVELAASGMTKPVSGTAVAQGGEVLLHGPVRAAQFTRLPALTWPDAWIHRHTHHHHRFDREPDGPGAEVEASRGCPFACSFCAKTDYRDQYRKRELPLLLQEIDGLLAQGVRYFYFIDEIFLPQSALLEALAQRRLEFGIQTRIDLWSPAAIEALGRAGCVSIEAGVESLTAEGRAELAKKCRMSTDEIADRLILARQHVPFVQANLIATEGDNVNDVARWRERLRGAGVWANDPVPLYPYPSSPEYRRRWGEPDDFAWERAHEHYLGLFDRLSDIQAQDPQPLSELEAVCVLE
jgi:anaerobic magnesium-protoporphyrin IX monomethyl ester cyclase